MSFSSKVWQTELKTRSAASQVSQISQTSSTIEGTTEVTTSQNGNVSSKTGAWQDQLGAAKIAAFLLLEQTLILIREKVQFGG